jgi:hypothetical protein
MRHSLLQIIIAINMALVAFSTIGGGLTLLFGTYMNVTRLIIPVKYNTRPS